MASKDSLVQRLFSFLQENRTRKQNLNVFFKDDLNYKFEIQFLSGGQSLKVVVPKTDSLKTLYQEVNGKREFYFGHCSPDVQKGAYITLDAFEDSENFSLNQVVSVFVGPSYKKDTRNHSYNSNRHFLFSVEELEKQGLDELVQFAKESGQTEYITIKDLAKYFEDINPSEDEGISQKCWLMTFNPLNKSYQYTVDDWAELISQIPKATDSWSTGGTKSLSNGDTVFVLRQGKDAVNDQRGIVGKGKVISDVYADENNKTKVDIQLERGVVNPPKTLSVQTLSELFPDYHWTPQGSGTSVPEEIAEYIEKSFSALRVSSSFERRGSKEREEELLKEVLTKLQAIPNFGVFAFANFFTKKPSSRKELAVMSKSFDALKTKWEDADIQFNFYIQNKSTSGKSLNGEKLSYEKRKEFFELIRSILGQYHFKIEGIYNDAVSYPKGLSIGFEEDYLPEFEAQFGAAAHHMFLNILGRREGVLIEKTKFIAEESVVPYKAEKTLPKPSKETVQRIERLKHFKNLVLEGVPGTGKTFALNTIKLYWLSQTKRPLFEINDEVSQFAMTFHPSTSYEDFVEGLRPLTSNDKKSPLGEKVPEAVWFYDKLATSKGNWGIKDGFFLKVCQKAIQHPNQDFIILLDELNRANIPKVFGDLITTIERSKRAVWKGTQDNIETTNPKDWNTEKCQIVELPYSGRKFFVPDNIYIVATQNTTDRSVAPLDAALRRRFAFLRMNPHSYLDIQRRISPKSFQRSLLTWAQINQKLQEEIGPDAVLGHSYFYVVCEEVKDKSEDEQYSALRFVWEQELLPQLIDTLQSADRIDLLEEFQEMFDKLDSKYRFKIEISGEALYRLPIISLEEKKTPQKLIETNENLGPIETLAVQLQDLLQKEEGKSSGFTRFRLNDDLGLKSNRRLFHIDSVGDVFIQRDEENWPNMLAYMDEQLSTSTIFTKANKCSVRKVGNEYMLRIPQNVWHSSLKEFIAYLEAMIKTEMQ